MVICNRSCAAQVGLNKVFLGSRFQEQTGPDRMTRLQMSLEKVKRRDSHPRAVNRA